MLIKKINHNLKGKVQKKLRIFQKIQKMKIFLKVFLIKQFYMKELRLLMEQKIINSEKEKKKKKQIKISTE